MYQIHYFVLFSLFILCARSESLTYYTIRDKWENALLDDYKDVSPNCAFALDGFKREIKKPTINWALQMLDATTKLQPGILYGNLRDYGSFDQCLEIEGVVVNGDESKNIIGRHCMTISPLASLLTASGQLRIIDQNFRDNENGNQLNEVAAFVNNLVWSVCVPQLCDADDLNKLFKILNLKFDDNNCKTKNDIPNFTVDDVLASAFFGLLLFILISSTTYDVYLHYTEQKSRHMVLIAFSALSNGKKLLTVNNNSSQLKCLDGLRFLSMMWVVLGHSYSLLSIKPIFNLIKQNDWIHKISSMYVIGATVSVDTFFVLSGLVMTYVFLMAAQKGVKFNLILYYVHRYLRLTPALIGIIVVQLTFLKFMSSGPQWSQLSKLMLIEPCQNAWWVTLLYLQNYVKTTQQCVGVSWYLAVDMQLFVLSPLILFPLKKWPKYTIIGVFLLAFGSVIWGFILAWDGKWAGLIIGQDDPNQTLLEMQTEYYIKTHMRAAPWLIGVVLGYLIFKHKNGKRFKIHKMIALALWIVSLVVLATCVFGGYNLQSNGHNIRLESAMYVAFIRPAWAIALCWVIYACLFGYGGPINAFLCWKAFRIGSRFTYSIYIVHYTLLITLNASITLPINFSDYSTIHTFIGDFIIAFLIAICWTLIFESPIIILEKIMFGNSLKANPKIDNLPEVKVTTP